MVCACAVCLAEGQLMVKMVVNQLNIVMLGLVDASETCCCELYINLKLFLLLHYMVDFINYLNNFVLQICMYLVWNQ